jgi:hypothetical protein
MFTKAYLWLVQEKHEIILGILTIYAIFYNIFENL